MENKELILRPEEKIIATFRPKKFWRRFFTSTSINATLIITNKRVLYKNPPNIDRELDITDIYDVRVAGRYLNILKRGDSLDYDYDANFETFELDRAYISVGWLHRPQLIESIIEGFMPEPK